MRRWINTTVRTLNRPRATITRVPLARDLKGANNLAPGRRGRQRSVCDVLVGLAAILCVALHSDRAFAAPVQIEHQGLTLNANLMLASADGYSDGVVLLVHGTLAHHKMELISELQTLLAEREINTLGISLALGISNRTGMYDCAVPHQHRHGDAVVEIALWRSWLLEHGAKRVGLLGHSRGGAQVALFLQKNPGIEIPAAILIAPPIAEPGGQAGAYARRFATPLAPILERAERLIAAGRDSAYLDATGFLYCQSTRVSAASFVSYYATDPASHDTPGIVSNLDVPLLIIAGSEDTVATNLAAAVAPLAATRRQIRFVEIDGADHFFRDLYAEDLSDLIAEVWNP